MGRKGRERGTTPNFLHTFPLSGTPVVQSSRNSKTLKRTVRCESTIGVEIIAKLILQTILLCNVVDYTN